jgi:hypothetical protein
MMIVLGFICSALLGAWLLLEFELAEGALILIILSVVGLGIYWGCTGSWGTETAKGIRVFAALLVLLGFTRLGMEKLSDILFGKPRS